MKKNKLLQHFALGTFAAAMSLSASAALITHQYDVSNQARAAQSCDSAYGLYTSTLHLGSASGCANLYSLQSGAKFIEYDDGTAKLVGRAKNQSGVIAYFNLNFFGFQDNYSPVKSGGSSNTEDWNFYTGLTSDSFIHMWSSDIIQPFHPQLVGAPANIGKMPVFQYGKGANDKTGAFGGSVWLDVVAESGEAYTGANHWDLNFDLGPDLGPEVPVPVPATLGLLALGIAALRFSRYGK